MLFKKKNLYEKIAGLLLPFLPLALVSGPLLSDFIIIIISIGFLITSYQKNLWYYYKNIFFFIFFIFWIYLILNSLFNNFNLNSIRISLTYIRFGIFFIAVIYLINFDRKIQKNFFLVGFLTILILVLDGFYQYLNGYNIFGYKAVLIDGGYRISSFFGDELILGSFLSRMFPIFFGLWVLYKVKFNNIINFIIVLNFILIQVLIYLSGERTSFFFVNLSILFIILFFTKKKFLVLIILILSILSVVIVSALDPVSKGRIVNLTKMQIFTEKKVYIFSEVHTGHYTAAYKMFLNNKFFGIGVGNFRKFCNDELYSARYSCSTHPHNTYLQILAEIGILGFAFIFFIFILFLTKVYRHFILILKGKYLFNDFEISMLSAILVTLWPLVPSGNFFNNWLSIIYFLPLGFLVSSLNKKYNFIRLRYKN